MESLSRGWGRRIAFSWGRWWGPLDWLWRLLICLLTNWLLFWRREVRLRLFFHFRWWFDEWRLPAGLFLYFRLSCTWMGWWRCDFCWRGRCDFRWGWRRTGLRCFLFYFRSWFLLVDGRRWRWLLMNWWRRLCFLLGCDWNRFNWWSMYLFLFLLMMDWRRWGWRRIVLLGSRDGMYLKRRGWGCVPLWLLFLMVN